MPLTHADIAAGAHLLPADGYGLFLASNEAVLKQLDTSAIRPERHVPRLPGPAAERVDAADMMRVYNMLNAAAFGEKGIPLQNWVMIDLGLLPSAFLLVALRRAERAR